MNKRNSNLELLRIIAIFMIVFHHIGFYGLKIESDLFTYNYIIKSFLALPGKLGVNIFILISAYFMTNTKFEYKKLIKLVSQILFYSIRE